MALGSKGHGVRVIGSPISQPPSIGREKYCARPAFSCQTAFQSQRSPAHFGSRNLVASLRTSHPSGSRLGSVATLLGRNRHLPRPWLRSQPQKTLCSPAPPIAANRCRFAQVYGSGFGPVEMPRVKSCNQAFPTVFLVHPFRWAEARKNSEIAMNVIAVRAVFTGVKAPKVTLGF